MGRNDLPIPFPAREPGDDATGLISWLWAGVPGGTPVVGILGAKGKGGACCPCIRRTFVDKGTFNGEDRHYGVGPRIRSIGFLVLGSSGWEWETIGRSSGSHIEISKFL